MLLPVPIVVDADVLLRDVQYVVRKGYLSALLGGASPRYTLMTGVALFATPRVIEEVVRHLPDVANRTGRTEDAVNAVWTERVLPLVRVVSVRDDAVADARVEAVRARHAADAPTAALTVLLAPAVLATNNHSTSGHSSAPPPRRPTNSRSMSSRSVRPDWSQREQPWRHHSGPSRSARGYGS
jgi:hypothetical protein